MDLDSVKENIQPLASGRNIERLEAALNAESHQEIQEILLQQRQQYETGIRTYTGDDPLSAWYDYVQWVEQSYPKSGKESALDEIILKCLVEFEQEEKYKQDPRMIKLYIKYIDSQPNPQMHFQTLYNQGIGTMVADLYICWAYYYDICDNFEKADAVFRKGIDAHAEPADQLDQAHKQFGFSMSQRLLNKQNETYRQQFLDTMEERRFALTSLRAHKHVGSVRTGRAVKSYDPGRVQQQLQPTKSGSSSSSAVSNAKVKVFQENDYLGTEIATHSTSVVQSIMDSSRKQENLREPGPWSKANKTGNAKAVGTVYSTKPGLDRTLAFPILVDMDESVHPTTTSIPLDDDKHAKGIQLPPNFRPQNIPQTEFTVPYFVEEDIPATHYAHFDKIMLFPKADRSFSCEELRAYKWFQKRNIKNEFTKMQDGLWKNVFEVGIRLPPQFCNANVTQEEWKVERVIDDAADSVAQGKSRFMSRMNCIYPVNSGSEYSNEELLKEKWIQGELRSQKCPVTDEGTQSMDETAIHPGRQSIYKRVVRKSVVPGGRKSILPVSDEGRLTMYGQKPSSSARIEEELSEIPDNNSKDVLSGGKSDSTEVKFAKCPVFVFESKPKLVNVSSVKKNDAAEPRIPQTPSPHIEEEKSVFSEVPLTKPIISAVKNEQKVVGVTRKSIYPSKRKNDSPDVDIPFKEPCLNEAPSITKISPEVAVISPAAVTLNTSPFKIFEDSQGKGEASPENIFQTKSDDVIFKTPQLLSDFHRNPLQLQPDDAHEFEANDTCSTHQFNFFIKSESISTPKANRRQTTVLKPLDPPSPLGNDAGMGAAGATIEAPTNISPQENYTIPQPRQLSTIMETTETNTLSSATASTKSSVDTQISSSPETEFEVTAGKSQQRLTKSTYKSNYSATGTDSATLTASGLVDQFSTRKSKVSISANNDIMPSLIEEKQSPALTLQEEKSMLSKIFSRSDALNVMDTPYQSNGEADKENFPINDNTVNAEKPVIIPTKFSIYEDKPTEASPEAPKLSKICDSEEKSIAVVNVVKSIGKPSSLPPPPKDVTLPSMSSVQNYEDRTETIPTMNFNRKDFAMPAKDITIPSMCPIYIYEDRTETLPTIPFCRTQNVAMPQRDMAIPPRDITIPPLCSTNIYEDKTETIPAMPFNVIESSMVIPRLPPAIPSFSVYEDKTEDVLPVVKRNISSVKIGDNMLEILPTLINPLTLSESGAGINANDEHIMSPSPPANTVELNKTDDDLYDLFTQTPTKQRTTSFAPFPAATTAKGNSPNDSFELMMSCSSKEPLFKKIISPGKSRIPVSNMLRRSSVAAGTTVKPVDPLNASESLLEPMSFNPCQSTLHCNATNSSSTITISDNTLQNTCETDRYVCANIEEKSVHIKEEPMDSTLPPKDSFPKILSAYTVQPHSFDHNYTAHCTVTAKDVSISLDEQEMLLLGEHGESACPTPLVDMENSIYVKRETIQFRSDEYVGWSEINNGVDGDADSTTVTAENVYLPQAVDLNETRQIIEAHVHNVHVNPFDTKLQMAFLEQYDLLYYISTLSTCTMLNTVLPIKPKEVLAISDRQFDVLALIGKGSFGHVFSAKCRESGKIYALKQERPANLWEYYICLEIESRIEIPNILPAFMSVEYSLIGNNASILFSTFSKYGTMINVCNKIKENIGKNVPESIVMVLAKQMLAIVDHLHACNIIHADIKPDNILLMKRLNYDSDEIVLQLIDFGQAIDLKLYPPGQTFLQQVKTKNFTCIEMMENKPWTFQTDLYCLAGTIHTILFGRYMDVVKKLNGYQIKTIIPRYYRKNVWETLFSTLINVRDCNTMPNLQTLRTLLLEEIRNSNEKATREAIVKFNNIIDQ